MREVNQKPDGASTELWNYWMSNSQIYRNTLNTQSRKIQNWEKDIYCVLSHIYLSLTWRVKSWSIMGGRIAVPSQPQQTRLIYKTLHLNVPTCLGLPKDLVSVSPKPRLWNWRAASMKWPLKGRGDYIYGARDMGEEWHTLRHKTLSRPVYLVTREHFKTAIHPGESKRHTSSRQDAGPPEMKSRVPLALNGWANPAGLKHAKLIQWPQPDMPI